MENCINNFPIFAIFPENGVVFRTRLQANAQASALLSCQAEVGISALSLESVATVVGQDVSQIANLRGFILSRHDVNESLHFLAQVGEFVCGHSRSIKNPRSVLAGGQTAAANRGKG